MQTKLTGLARWLWLPALGLLLAACTAPQTPAATLTLPPATVAATAAVTIAPTVTSAPTEALATATVAPTAAPATNTAPAATAQPAGPTPTATLDPAVSAVLAYLQARALADVATVTNLSCKSWKSKAVTEAVSFHSMNAKLVGVTCQVNGSAGGFTLVSCGGKMVTTYGTESKDWDLSAFTYQVALEDGQWKMCGYH